MSDRSAAEIIRHIVWHPDCDRHTIPYIGKTESAAWKMARDCLSAFEHKTTAKLKATGWHFSEVRSNGR